jgi:magnesium-transporting ATPase (P-type)
LHCLGSQSLFDDGYQSLYNLMFTSLPVMFFAVLDRDVEVRRAHERMLRRRRWSDRYVEAYRALKRRS